MYPTSCPFSSVSKRRLICHDCRTWEKHIDYQQSREEGGKTSGKEGIKAANRKEMNGNREYLIKMGKHNVKRKGTHGKSSKVQNHANTKPKQFVFL